MAPDLTFGPEGEQWHYTCATQTFDLTRGSGQKYSVRTTAGAPSTNLDLDPGATALVVVVDTQNYFLDPRCTEQQQQHATGAAAAGHGAVSRAGDRGACVSFFTSRRRAIVRGVVIWLNWGLTPGDLAAMPASVHRGLAALAGRRELGGGLGLGADLGGAGSWNAEVVPALAADDHDDDDVHCAKNRMSGLWTPAQPLWRHFDPGEGQRKGEGKKKKKKKKKKRKTTLLFAGVNTDQCVQGTLVDAYNAGWDCVLLDDCCGTTTPGGHAVTVFNVALYYGFVTDSESFVAGTVG
ncbi:isochorismatase [Xylariomycetidae sp. FL0641]|nr:isochorismatase [Xylariomycetidae sp. FL0641]